MNLEGCFWVFSGVVCTLYPTVREGRCGSGGFVVSKLKYTASTPFPTQSRSSKPARLNSPFKRRSRRISDANSNTAFGPATSKYWGRLFLWSSLPFKGLLSSVGFARGLGSLAALLGTSYSLWNVYICFDCTETVFSRPHEQHATGKQRFLLPGRPLSSNGLR
jgi:hypothetical protein